MSFVDLYLNKNPLITDSSDDNPTAIVFGVPFDSTHSYRPGTRFGPDAIRQAFNNIELFYPEYGVDLESVRIEDLGNIQHTVDPAHMVDMTQKVAAELAEKGRQVFILGGEHLLTLGAYRAFADSAGFVVFDAHYDLRDSYGDVRLNHATYLRRIAEQYGPDRIIHVGARAFTREEMAFARENSIMTVTDRQIRDGQGPRELASLAASFDRIYASFDLDVLDPAFAPGVGNPEAAGIMPRELFGMIDVLRDTRTAAVDIVELNPMADSGATSAIAAKIMSTMIAMNAS